MVYKGYFGVKNWRVMLELKLSGICKKLFIKESRLINLLHFFDKRYNCRKNLQDFPVPNLKLLLNEIARLSVTFS